MTGLLIGVGVIAIAGLAIIVMALLDCFWGPR